MTLRSPQENVTVCNTSGLIRFACAVLCIFDASALPTISFLLFCAKQDALLPLCYICLHLRCTRCYMLYIFFFTSKIYNLRCVALVPSGDASLMERTEDGSETWYVVRGACGAEKMHNEAVGMVPSGTE